ncbi:hypothetical protein C7N43_20965 [Sphingobacteriales bacterium UPWRP_1]|nr:hypothetical protein BVG80_15840 [Sphingobacteriales bacterium TSM_CSM]PSJ75054.1 hypothetical protein C7N43_20965 [Sphingobacteriales bacterium UPWRP_1]
MLKQFCCRQGQPVRQMENIHIMLIANPIYDVVFKYLMEDNKIAKLLISSIIGQEITHLNLRPQEFLGETGFRKNKKLQKAGISIPLSLTIYRIDFAANIKTGEGEKLVIIEIQKTRFPSDIMRFRKYLGKQYADVNNAQEVVMGHRKRKSGIPIISIYFIGYNLQFIHGGLVAVTRQCKNPITGEVYQAKEPFIEGLTHDSYIIQIPQLTQKRRNELEILLSVFDQSRATNADYHLLNVKEEDFPPKYRPVIRRLQQAISQPEIKTKMDMEDTLLNELELMEREYEEALKEIKLARKQAKLAEQRKIRLEQQIEQERQEKLRAEQQIEQERQEKLRAEQQIEQERQEKLRAEQQIEQERQEKLRAEQQITALKNELEALKKQLNKKTD